MKETNLTVRTLKECLKDIPDDMEVIIPVIDVDDSNNIQAFRHVRTIGILECNVENDALCLNTASDGLDINSQINGESFHADSSIKCKKVIF